jgi:WD40 repeat protein
MDDMGAHDTHSRATHGLTTRARKNTRRLPEAGWLECHADAAWNTICGRGRAGLASGPSRAGVNWDVHSHRLVGQLNNHAGAIASLAFSPDARTLAAGDIRGGVVLWNVRGRKPVGVPLQTHHLVNSVTYSPNGETLAVGNGDNGTVGFWDVHRQHLIRTLHIGTSGPVNSVAFAPDKPILATGSETGAVQLWSLPGDKPLATLTGTTGPIFSVAFGPHDGTLAAGGFSGTISVWRAVR